MAAWHIPTVLAAVVVGLALGLMLDLGGAPERLQPLGLGRLAVALAIAVATFPDRPLVAVALVVGPLVEVPVLALAAGHFQRRRAVDTRTLRRP